MGTWIIAILLAGVLGLVIYRLWKNKKAGKTTCGCGCGGCANAPHCHGTKQS